jgi:hypothetical protein
MKNLCLVDVHVEDVVLPAEPYVRFKAGGAEEDVLQPFPDVGGALIPAIVPPFEPAISWARRWGFEPHLLPADAISASLATGQVSIPTFGSLVLAPE